MTMVNIKILSVKNILLAILVALPQLASAQSDRDLIRQGNKAYRAKQYPQSEVKYRKALSVNASNSQALYNLGCALMVQNKMQEAVKFFQQAGGLEKNKMRRAMAYHNIGIICQGGKMYEEAIKAYQESLRNNPHDNETRYNLALCKKLLKNNSKQNNNKNKQKDNKNKQDKNNRQQQQNKNDNQQSNKRNEQQPRMSKDNAEQLLNAAMQQEQQTQQRLNKGMQQQQNRRLEKNW